MNKARELVLLIVASFLFVSCEFMLAPSEGKIDYSNWLVRTDTLGIEFNKLINFSRHPQDLIQIENYIVTPNQEYIIVNKAFNGIWRHDHNGRNPLKLSDTLWVRDTEIALSSSGSMIAFTSRGNIYRVNLDGSDLTKITNSPHDNDDFPDFYENGDKIIYTRENSYADSAHYYSICSINIDGNEFEEILKLGERAMQVPTYPLYIKDKNLILYKELESKEGLYIYDIESQNLNCLFEGNIMKGRIKITQDKNQIITNDGYRVYVIDLSGNILQNIYEDTSESFNNYSISSDGKILTLGDFDELYMMSSSSDSLRYIGDGESSIIIENNIYYVEKEKY